MSASRHVKTITDTTMTLPVAKTAPPKVKPLELWGGGVEIVTLGTPGAGNYIYTIGLKHAFTKQLQTLITIF